MTKDEKIELVPELRSALEADWWEDHQEADRERGEAENKAKLDPDYWISNMSDDRPLVIVEVSGGVAQLTYSRGEVDLVIIDHDNEEFSFHAQY